MYPHHAGIHRGVPAPEMGNQSFGGHDGAGRLHKHLQNLKLPPAQRLGTALVFQLERRPVQHHRPTGQPVGQVGLLAAQHRPHPGQQLRRGKGFGQIVVRPGVQPFHPLGHLGAGGQEQRRGVDPQTPQFPQHLDTVHLRHHDIQHQTVVLGGAGIEQRVPSIGHPVGTEIVALKNMQQRFQQPGIVFRHQQSHELHLTVWYQYTISGRKKADFTFSQTLCHKSFTFAFSGALG